MRSTTKDILLLAFYTVICAAVCFVFYFFSSMAVSLGGRNVFEAKKSDCILLLGARGEEATEERAALAAQLYFDGYSDTIIASGGGDEQDAQRSKAMLLSLGVPEEAVILERVSLDTAENLLNCKAIMNQKGFSTALIVTNDLHLTRAVATARKLNMNVCAAGAQTSVNRWSADLFHECIGIMHYAIRQWI